MTAPQFHFIHPPEQGAVSGGFLVNRAIIDADLCSTAPAADAGELAASFASVAPTRPIMIDSLYLFDDACPQIVALEARRRPLGLLAHSLPSLIPGPPAANRRLRLDAESALLRATRFAVAPSAFMRSALERRGLGRDAIRIVEPAPVCDGRPGPGSSVRSSPGDPVRLLTVANWSPAKGIDIIVRALAQLASDGWHWTVVGDTRQNAQYSSTVRDAIAAAGLSSRVSVVPPVSPEQLGRHYAAADIFVLPSYMESYGIVYAEAISHLRPVVALNVAAVPEVVRDAGWLVTPESGVTGATDVAHTFAGALGEAVRLCRGRGAAWAAMIERVGRRAASLPTIERLGAAVAAAVHEALAAPVAGGGRG